MSIVKIVGINYESIYFFVFMGLHKHYLFQTKGQARTMTKLYSLVVLYKGDTAAHILKVVAGLVG